jgi:uncharacterized protein (UPF0335 family)
MAKLKERPQPMTQGDMRNSNTAAMLYGFVERLERLAEERAGLGEDMKEVREEAKGMGFDTAVLNMVIRRRKMDAATRMETDSMLELYEDVVAQQAKKQTADSLSEADEPAPAAKGWAKKAQQARVSEPVQTDIEDVAEPVPDEVQSEAARQIAHAADHPDASDVGNIPSFLRRAK